MNKKGEWVPRNERKRRDDDDYDYDYDQEDEENLSDCDGSETGVWKDLCENIFDDAGEGQIQARRKKKVIIFHCAKINPFRVQNWANRSVVHEKSRELLAPGAIGTFTIAMVNESKTFVMFELLKSTPT